MIKYHVQVSSQLIYAIDTDIEDEQMRAYCVQAHATPTDPPGDTSSFVVKPATIAEFLASRVKVGDIADLPMRLGVLRVLRDRHTKNPLVALTRRPSADETEANSHPRLGNPTHARAVHIKHEEKTAEFDRQIAELEAQLSA